MKILRLVYYDKPENVILLLFSLFYDFYLIFYLILT